MILLDIEIKPVNPKGNQTWMLIGKDGCWSWNSSILVSWCEQQTHWKSPWFWERLRVEGEENTRGWDGWMASLMPWTWTWAKFGRWWGTGKLGMLQCMGSQGWHDWATEQQQRILGMSPCCPFSPFLLKMSSHLFLKTNPWGESYWNPSPPMQKL